MRNTILRRTGISKLFPELLGNVFLHCLEHTHDPHPIISEAPLVLCFVCHLWRDVAFATPSLWARIEFSASGRVLSHFRASAIQKWMDRARNCPITLSLRFTTFPIGGLDILSCITVHSRKWRQLSLKIPLRALELMTAEMNRRGLGSLRNIERLRIEILEEEYPFMDTDVARAVGFSNLIQDPDSRTSKLGPRLRKLALYGVAADPEFLNILKDIPRLEWLELLLVDIQKCGFGSPPHSGTRPRPPRVVIPHLNHLDIRGGDGLEDVSRILLEVSLPALKSLHLHVNLVENYPSHLRTFFLDTKPDLACLDVRDNPMANDEFVHCLKLVPCLRSLILDNTFLDHDTLVALREKNGPGQAHCLLPHLEKLGISKWEWVGSFWQFEQLASLVKERCWNPTSTSDVYLKELDLELMSDPAKRLMSKVGTCVATGRFHVTFSGQDLA